MPCIIFQLDLVTKKSNITFPESLGLRSKVLRNIEELRNEMKSASLDIPDEFLCPITKELMKEPVIAAGKRTEDGLAIFIIW